MVTYADAHAVTNPNEANQVIWGQVFSEDGFHIMAYDVPSAKGWDAGKIPFFVSVRGDDPAMLTQYWESLLAGGTVIEPFGPSGFSPLYGIV